MADQRAHQHHRDRDVGDVEIGIGEFLDRDPRGGEVLAVERVVLLTGQQAVDAQIGDLAVDLPREGRRLRPPEVPRRQPFRRVRAHGVADSVDVGVEYRCHLRFSYPSCAAKTMRASTSAERCLRTRAAVDLLIEGRRTTRAEIRRTQHPTSHRSNGLATILGAGPLRAA